MDGNNYGVTRVNTDTLEIHPTNYSQNSNDTYLKVFGKVDINSDLDLGGDISVIGNSDVTGNSTVTGHSTIAGTATISGATYISGPTTLQNSLQVDAITDFYDDVTIKSSGVATDKNTLTIADLGNGTAIQNVVVNSSGELEATTLTTAYTLPMATSTSLGGIKVGNGLSVDATGELSVDPNGITFPWTVKPTGQAYRNSNIGIGDFSSNTPSYPLHISIPPASGTNYAAKIEGGSGLYVQEDVIVGGQIITSNLAPLTGTKMVTVGTDGILTTQAIPSLSSQWTASGSDISNNNTGDIIASSSISNLLLYDGGGPMVDSIGIVNL